MDLSEQKKKLIKDLQGSGYLKTQKIIRAFQEIPREAFVPKEIKEMAYIDEPQPISQGQTISAPHMVAIMTELLEPQPSDTVLEIGGGSGYQAAILSRLVKKIFSIELEGSLASSARRALKSCGIKNVQMIQNDGSKGLAPKAPFDKIIITCACKEIPKALKDQLKVGGILIAPVGGLFGQTLTLLRKTERGFKKESHGGVAFVPLRH